MSNRKEWDRKYRKTHSKKIKEGRRKYYYANREKLRESNRKWLKANPEKVKEYPEKYRKANREKLKVYQKVWRKAKREKTAGRKKSKQCEVCGAMGKICFDHDHKTGEFRGWICMRCNSILGYVEDKIEILELLIKYLKNN